MKRYRHCSKELIILTEHFSPSMGATAQLITDLADDLHSSGVRLRILTSTPGSSNSPYPVHRFSVASSNSVGVLHKLTNGLTFFLGTFLWLSLNIKKSHTLLIVSNPPFIGIVGILLSFLRKTRYIFLLQDIFPRSASLAGILPVQGPITFFWRFLTKSVLYNSEASVVLSDAMLNRCRIDFGPNVPLVSIPNWSVLEPQVKPKNNSCLAKEWELDGTFTIQYSGNFGRLHDILTILEAARLLQDHPIKFLFVGGGAKTSHIERYRSTYSLNNVSIHSYQPRCLLSDSLAASDLSIVSLVPGAEDTVAPSKFYGILASSRPVLLIASQSSELASIVNRSRCGVVVPQGDVQMLCQAILQLQQNSTLATDMAKNASILYKNEYGRSRSVGLYYQFLVDHSMV